MIVPRPIKFKYWNKWMHHLFGLTLIISLQFQNRQMFGFSILKTTHMFNGRYVQFGIFSFCILQFVSPIKQVNISLFNVLQPLSQQHSHGIITGYKLTTNNTKSPVNIGANELCYSIASGNEKNNQLIKVSAKNSAGLSPPFVLIVPHHPGEYSKYVQKAVGMS